MVVGQDIPVSADDKPGPDTPLSKISWRPPLRKRPEEITEGVFVPRGKAWEITKSHFNILNLLDYLEVDYSGTNFFRQLTEICRDHGGLGKSGACWNRCIGIFNGQGHPQSRSHQSPDHNQSDENAFESVFVFHVFSPFVDNELSKALLLIF